MGQNCPKADALLIRVTFVGGLLADYRDIVKAGIGALLAASVACASAIAFMALAAAGAIEAAGMTALLMPTRMFLILPFAFGLASGLILQRRLTSRVTWEGSSLAVFGAILGVGASIPIGLRLICEGNSTCL